MEPLSITSSIAGILGGVATVASKINTLKQRYSQSELNITLTSSMLFSVKRALESIQEMRDGSRDTSKASQQLDKDLGVPLESCAVLIAMVERSLEGIDLENPSRAEKWRFVRLNETFVQTERSLDAQVRALTLLLTIYQCGTLAEQTARLRSRDTRLVLDRVRRDTASTIQFLEDREGSDAASILSSEPSVKFMFDDDLLQHPMYQRTYPHLWRRNNLRPRDSVGATGTSPRQSVAIPPAMPPPPVPRKDVPSDQIQSPTATESDTVRASQAPPPPKSAPLQRTDTALLSPPSTAGLLSPNSAEGKKPRKKRSRSRSRSTGPDPLLGMLPSIPFLGIPFQGEQVESSSESEASEESEAEEVAADTAPATSAAAKPVEVAEASIDQPSETSADKAEVEQDAPTEDVSVGTPVEETEDQELRKLPSRAVKLQSKYRSRLSETPVKSDTESDLYGVSDQEYEPPAKSKSESASKSPPGSPEEVAKDIPTINVPQNETERPTTAVKVGSDSAAPEDNSASAHYAEENTQTDIDRIVSHIRHHRARSATDIGSTSSLRSESRGRSISDTTGKDQVKLDVDLQSRSPSRGESVSTRSDQPSQDAQESTVEVFSPKLDLPLLDDAGSFVINFDQRSSEGRASTTGASPAVAPVDEGEDVPVMNNLTPASTPKGSQDEDEAEESIAEEGSSPQDSPMQAAAPIRAPPVPSSADTPSSEQVPSPLRAPPPPPQTEATVSTSATLSRPPILPPMQSSPSAATERRSSVAKLSAPPIPPRPASRPVSQPPPALQQPSPQASPSLSQSPLQPSPASTPGLPTQAVTALPIKKLPPPVPPPRLARSVATRRASNASQATTATMATAATEQTETATVESPRRPPPPVPQQVAPSSPTSTPNSHASPQIPPKLQIDVPEEVARTPSVHAQTPPLTTAIAQQTSPPPTIYSPAENLQQTVTSDAASSIGSTMTGSRNSGSFWDAHSVASTHHTTVNNGLHPTLTNEGLPLDPSEDTVEQAAQRRLMTRLGAYDQKGRGKSKLLPKASTSRLSNIFGSSDKKLAKLKSMHEAARAGQIGILEEILREHRKSVNGLEKLAGSDTAKSMLMRAAEGDHVECMKFLVRFGADVAVADSHGQVALHYAIQNVSISATMWLAQYRPTVPSIGVNHIEIGDENGFRPLHVAAAKGNGTMMDILIQHGAIIDARDKYGRSPLFTATVSSNLAAIDKLINHGASLSHSDNEGRTPLMWAVEYDAPLVVDAFLGRQADRNVRDNDGNTIIHIAAKAGRLDMIDKLYLGKSDVEAQNFLGERPLHLAAEADKAAVVKGLLSIGCDPNVFTHPSSTTRNARKGSKKHSFKDYAASPLHYACASGAYDPAAALIMNTNNGASVNANQDDGTSPLMLAAEAKSAPIVGLLMQWGANIEAKTSADQLTVLHVAAAAGDLDTVKLLANNGAAVRTLNKKHETAWQYATKNGTKHNAATTWLSKYTRGQLAPNVHSPVGNASNTSVFHPAYGYVPSVPSPMYNNYDPNFPPNYANNYTATGYLPNQRTFYQPPHIQASVRTDEGIEPPPAYTPRRT